MSNTDNDIEIQVLDDEVKNTEPEIVVTHAERNDIPAQDGIEELKQRLEDERKARFQAEQNVREARESAKQARSEVDDTNFHLVSNAIDTVRRENEILKANYRDAMTVGDYDRSAEIQESMSNNAARLLQLENGKVAMQNRPREEPEQYASDPVEVLASQLSPRSADWVRKNPQCVTDPRLYQKMVAAHSLAVADGYQADSDDYFGFIEDTLKLNNRSGDGDSAMSGASNPTQRRASPAAAPVSRSGTGTGSRPNVVRLSSDEREMAKMMKMTDQEYAKNKMALQKSGRLN